MYHGEVLVLELLFPDNYHEESLIVTFLSNVSHPNVDELGRVQGDVLSNGQWSTIATVQMVTRCLLNLQENPESADDIVNDATASLYVTLFGDCKSIARNTLRA